ncbi:hypothetical protein OEA41_000750 [Lepraria neglecta]|uniref:Uncharacterized protein n=1 Tax=Lepraria neglecta TaxID=209136 RepID=A0AAD9ZIP3_9LECA|nr:hypothetical protein OEA41_000750 [Lepraria neglecta]
MFSIRSILSTSLLLTLLSSSVYANTPEQTQEETDDVAVFRQLLDQVDPPSLHEALHSYSPKKFQHGMFQEDRTAVEVIHKTQPNLATSIINLARKQTKEIAKDLKKRQVGAISNGTTTPASNPEPSTTQVTPVPPIVGSPTTSSGESTSAPAPFPTTSTDSSGATVVGSITPTATGASTTPAPGHSISLTAGQVITAINPAGLTVISTVGGAARTITPTGSATSMNTKAEAGQTRIQYQTSTGANGSKSVVTAVTFVGGGAAVETPSGTAGVGTTSAGTSPGLQTGEAVTSRGWGREMVLIVGGAVVVAGMM